MEEPHVEGTFHPGNGIPVYDGVVLKSLFRHVQCPQVLPFLTSWARVAAKQQHEPQSSSLQSSLTYVLSYTATISILCRGGRGNPNMESHWKFHYILSFSFSEPHHAEEFKMYNYVPVSCFFFLSVWWPT